ncbi:Uu.00g076540.m01.CDS01 [Anthostomella pinea]|uniref:Uu.00g076540.m01.CDS01 n=1 Tax=Anthostomella pinea TaxID=933095 RepID=A0AAI8VWL4_9PEZI|nr:Uu.00g076540.m01.CDS01 [Anthostomella pinea]
MLFSTVYRIVPLVAAVSLAAPTTDGSELASERIDITPRSGERTATVYSGSSCSGTDLGVLSAGIFNGEHSGCSNTGSAARSYYLYYDC